MWDALKEGEARYEEIRCTRLVEKHKIHDIVHRYNLQTMKTLNQSHQKKTVRKNFKIGIYAPT